MRNVTIVLLTGVVIFLAFGWQCATSRLEHVGQRLEAEKGNVLALQEKAAKRFAAEATEAVDEDVDELDKFSDGYKWRYASWTERIAVVRNIGPPESYIPVGELVHRIDRFYACHDTPPSLVVLRRQLSIAYAMQRVMDDRAVDLPVDTL